ncbi:MAG: hypothetical protein ACR2JC_06435 [Chloroflexota bacterium]
MPSHDNRHPNSLDSPAPSIGYSSSEGAPTLADFQAFLAGANEAGRSILLLWQMAIHIRQLEYEVQQLKKGEAIRTRTGK